MLHLCSPIRRKQRRAENGSGDQQTAAAISRRQRRSTNGSERGCGSGKCRGWEEQRSGRGLNDLRGRGGEKDRRGRGEETVSRIAAPCARGGYLLLPSAPAAPQRRAQAAAAPHHARAAVEGVGAVPAQGGLEHEHLAHGVAHGVWGVCAASSGEARGEGNFWRSVEKLRLVAWSCEVTHRRAAECDSGAVFFFPLLLILGF